MSHGEPAEGSTCMSCWEDLNADLYVEYKATEDGPWLPSGYCRLRVEHLLKTQWDTYVSSFVKTTCKAEQRRLIAKGPPMNLSDKTALPCPDDGEIVALWFSASPDEEQSPVLIGALIGEEREKYIEEQKSFVIHDEADDDHHQK